MYAIRVNKNIKVNQVSSRTHSVRSDSNLIDFFIRDCQMKLCPKCKQTKALSEFHKRRETKKGYASHCKRCRSESAKSYRQANLKEMRKRGQIAVSRHEKTERFKTTRKLYNQKHPERLKAQSLVKKAISEGKLEPLDKVTCILCGGQARNYHHYLGYASEHVFDVVPTCIPCHRKFHTERSYLF